MGVNGALTLEGVGSVSDSHVKADRKYLLQTFALSRESVFKILFSLRVVIQNASFLRTLQMTKTSLPSHLFQGSRDQDFQFQKRRYWKYVPSMHL